MRIRKTHAVLLALLSCLLPAATSLAEAPGVWFLNARLTGSDYVYLSVGGNQQEPPTSPEEVKLSWRWVESKTDIPQYPDPEAEVVYRQSNASGKRPQAWSIDGELTGFPTLGIGPGRELWLVADQSDSAALDEASSWSRLFDTVEAAWRQSAPQVPNAERLGALDIGRLGECVIRSQPVTECPDGASGAWCPLALPSHARPSRPGGYTYVQPNEPPRPRDLKDVEVRRFQRWLEARDPAACQGRDDYLILRLFPVPEEDIGRLRADHFLDVHWIQARSVAMTDLAESPWRPGVRALDTGAPANWQATIAFDETPEEVDFQGIDLCDSNRGAELCARDRELRARMYTWAPGAPNPGLDDIQGTLLEACSDQLGEAGPCNDPAAWRHTLGGSILTGYTGDIQLSQQPPIRSRLARDGSVEWRWQADLDAAVVASQAFFRLLDGANVELRLPDLTPPPSQAETTQLPSATPEPTTDRRSWGIAGFDVALEGDTLYLPGDVNLPLQWALAAAAGLLLLLVVLFVLRQLRRRPSRDATTVSRLRPDFDDPFPELPPSATRASRSKRRKEPPTDDDTSSSQESSSEVPILDGPPLEEPFDEEPALAELPSPPTPPRPPLPHFSIDTASVPDPQDAATLEARPDSNNTGSDYTGAGTAGSGTMGSGPMDRDDLPSVQLPELELPQLQEPELPETQLIVGAEAVADTTTGTSSAVTEGPGLGEERRIVEEDLEVTLADLPSARAALIADELASHELAPDELATDETAITTGGEELSDTQRAALRDRLQHLEERHQEDQQRIDSMAEQLKALEARLEQVVTPPPVATPDPEPELVSREQAQDAPSPNLTPDTLTTGTLTTDTATTGTLDRLRRELGRWIEQMWPLLRGLALEAATANDFESLVAQLPAPAQHELRTARATLERFRTATANSEPLDLDALGQVIMALQYLTEAFPLEQVEPQTRQALRQALKTHMPEHDLPANFHRLVRDLAQELGYEYRPAPYYQARLGREKYPHLEGHCTPLDLAARAGSDLRTEAGTVIRVEPPFFDRQGERVCGEAWIFE